MALTSPVVVGLFFTTFCAAALAQMAGRNDLDEEHASAVHKAIDPLLKDPYSVVYDLPALQKPASEDQTYCGCFNAKNSFGAYNGRQIFLGRFERTSVGILFRYTPFPGDHAQVDALERKACELGKLEVPC